MSKVGGGGSSKGGSYKARASTQNQRVGYSKALQTPQEHIITLRRALVNDDGTDRNVLTDVAAFCQYDRNNLNVSLEFVPGKKAKKDLRQFMFRLTKANMEEEYNSSGYGWDDEDKKDELRDDAARFVVIRERETQACVGFMHWRFTLTGELFERMEGEPSLLVYDLQLQPEIRRKGLGKHLMMLSEIVARKNNMSCVMVQACTGGVFTEFAKKLKGYVELEETPEDALVILQKSFNVQSSPCTPSTAASLAATFATKPAAPATPAKLKDDGDDAASAKATPEATAAAGAADRELERQRVQAAITQVEALKFDQESSEDGSDEEEEDDDESDGEEAEIDPNDLDGQADALILQLCDLFAQKNGRDPTEEEIQKWRDTFREAATEHGDTLYANDKKEEPPADTPAECKQQ
jgi:GNAT superfamily N-acetyltransferase